MGCNDGDGNVREQRMPLTPLATQEPYPWQTILYLSQILMFTAAYGLDKKKLGEVPKIPKY